MPNEHSIEEREIIQEYNSHVYQILKKSLPENLSDDPHVLFNLCELVEKWIDFLEDCDNFKDFIQEKQKEATNKEHDTLFEKPTLYTHVEEKKPKPNEIYPMSGDTNFK